MLVVEDEFAVLLLIEEMLTSLGCEITDTASDLPKALDRVAGVEVDAALLDINLAGDKVYPVAEVLRQRAIPIVFSTGYGLAGIAPEWADYPVIQKPFSRQDLAGALARATAN